MLPTKFQVTWPFCSGEMRKIDFQDGCHGGHLRVQIGMILAIFDLQVTPRLPTKFEPIGLLIQEKQKIDFQDGGHGGHPGYLTGSILAIYYLQDILMLPN